jgi:predicted DNA-binding transcriptional regulator AlpA
MTSSLAALVGELERRAAVAEREGATAPVANVYRLVLEELRGLGADGNGDGAPADAPDHLLSAAEVATRLGCSVKLVYRSAGRWPFTRRVGSRTLRFSAAGLQRWLERRR